jgi:hypothetical protein
MVLIILILLSAHAGASKVTERWKVCRSAELQSEYAKHDSELHGFIKKSIPSALEHTGDTSFDSHLVGVQSILRNWDAAEHVCNAGLLHSIYGTEGFQGFKLPLDSRSTIRGLIGDKAEILVWTFCMVDRQSVDEEIADALSRPQAGTARFKSRVELGHFDIELPFELFLDFVELVLADWLEQVEGAAEKDNVLFGWSKGHAWGYRREAYKNMAALLVKHVPRLRGVADAMHREVYDAEPLETRGIHQPLTPPMSEAAREARVALASRSF